MSETFLSSGQSSSGVTLGAGDTLYVGSGATTSNMVLTSGGEEFVLGGGLATDTTVNAGGFLYATGDNGAVAVISGGTIEADAEAVITDDGSAVGIHVDNQGLLSIVSGGVGSGAVISSGGFETVYVGASATATEIQNGGTLVVLPGATLTDTSVAAGGRVVSTGLFFFSSTDPFSISGLSATTQPVSGADLTAGAGVAILPDGSLIDATIGSGAGAFVYGGGVLSGGSIASGGSATIGDYGSALGVDVQNGGRLVLSSGSNEAGLPTSTVISGITIENGGAVDVENASVSATLSGDTLTVSSGAQTVTIDLTGDYDGASLSIGSDQNGGTLITVDDGTPCYCPGTRIATPDGERPIEALAIGDLVLTRDHGARPIRWIGGRSYPARFAARNADVLPVVIRAGALADRVPHQDLWVSPLHALVLDGVLIPAVALLNGVSIVQPACRADVSYLHLEFEQHEVIFANGAEAESFLDDNSRGMFHNHRDYDRLYPDAPDLLPVYCAPRVTEGAALEAIRDRLRARVHGLGKAVRQRALIGYVDVVTPGIVAGWVHDPETPGEPVRLEAWDGDRLITVATADRARSDVLAAGAAPVERVGFTIALGQDVNRNRFNLARRLELRCARTGALFAAPVIPPVRAVA